jgi:uncharacterized protein (DUF1778 family)
MSTSILRKERINLRTTPRLKWITTRAAERVIADAETIVLNNEERNRFLALLDNPPPPNEALKAAMRKQREHLKL